MEFHRRVKGMLTQSLVQALFEDAGYKVLGLGIEEIIREVKDTTPKLYHSIPKGLRALPDFLILDERKQQSWLLEVKYRKRWDKTVADSLHDTLMEQSSHWNEFLFLVFIGQTPSNTESMDHCRIFKLRSRYRQLEFESAQYPGKFHPWSVVSWTQAFSLSSIFPNFNSSNNQSIQRCCEFALAYSIILDGH